MYKCDSGVNTTPLLSKEVTMKKDSIEVVRTWQVTCYEKRRKIRIKRTKKIAYIHWVTGPCYWHWFADKGGNLLPRKLMSKEYVYV